MKSRRKQQVGQVQIVCFLHHIMWTSTWARMYHIIFVMLLHGYFLDQKLLFDYLALLLHFLREFLLNLLWYVCAYLVRDGSDVVFVSIVKALWQSLHQFIVRWVRRSLLTNVFLDSHPENLFQFLWRFLILLTVEGDGRLVVRVILLLMFLLLLCKKLRLHLLHFAVPHWHLLQVKRWCFRVVWVVIVRRGVFLFVINLVCDSRLRYVVRVFETTRTRRQTIKWLRWGFEIPVQYALVVVIVVTETRAIISLRCSIWMHSVLAVLVSLKAVELFVIQNTTTVVCTIWIVGRRWGQCNVMISIFLHLCWKQRLIVVVSILLAFSISRWCNYSLWLIFTPSNDDVVGFLSYFRLGSDWGFGWWNRFLMKHVEVLVGGRLCMRLD